MNQFSNTIAEATQGLSSADRTTLTTILEEIFKELQKKEAACTTSHWSASDTPTDVPDAPTDRHVKLKENFLKQVPSITTHRARTITQIAKENPGLPKMLLRAKSFRRCCETAPLLIQDHELIVGAPNGAPRAGAFSPDIAWR